MSYQNNPLLLLTALTTMALLSACGGGPREMRVTEGSEPVGRAEGTRFQSTDATIVHVNERERLATMRHGESFASGTFLETVNRSDERTGLLKTIPRRPSGLRTADILDGQPNINDRAIPINAAEQKRLQQLYPESQED